MRKRITEKDIRIMEALDKFVETGTKYAEKSWVYTFNRMGKADIYERMRNIVKGIIPQAAFEFLLKQKKINYQTKPRERWYEINRYDIFVDNRKYDIKANFIDTSKREFRNLSPDNVTPLLDCSALVPTDQLHSRSMEDNDIYIFCFLTGEIKNLNNYQPNRMLFREKDGNWILHGFWEYQFIKPPKWIKKHGNESLGKITIISKNKNDDGKEFLVGGTKEEKNFYVEKVKLNNCEATTKEEFFQLFFIRPLDCLIPYEKLIIKTEAGYEEIIHPKGGFKTQKIRGKIQLRQNDWNDIWIYNPTIYFVGYMTKKEFLNKSEEIERFDKTVKQFEPKTLNNRLYVYQLRPIDEIL
ncbi:MAG: hypothetical protein QXI58_06785 [Candidatus Micrarchaeia archaeon]